MSDNIEVVRIYGDTVLKKHAEEITEFDSTLHDIGDCMVRTMYAKDGIGLSGPQIGLSRRIAVIDLSFGNEVDNILIMVNPEILETDGESNLEEGCLSIPGIYEELVRPEKIVVRYHDLYGEVHEIEADSLLARIIQHEADHFDGILFVDRLGTLKRRLLSKKLRLLVKEGKSE